MYFIICCSKGVSHWRASAHANVLGYTDINFAFGLKKSFESYEPGVVYEVVDTDDMTKWPPIPKEILEVD